MKDLKNLIGSSTDRGNKRLFQSVKNNNKEIHMNIPMITTISVISLGLLAFVANRIMKVAAQQPILIERRQIIYKRRP